MKDNQNMPLENLPEYLKSLKEQGSYGDSPVVQVGYIEDAPKKSWTGWLVATALLLAVGVGGATIYQQSQPNNITYVVDIDQNLNANQAIPAIFANSGGDVVEVKKTEGVATYEVTVSTHEDKRSFLERLLGHSKVKKATIKE